MLYEAFTDDPSSAITYTGTWTHNSVGGGAYNGTQSYSNTTNNTAAFSCAGNQLQVQFTTDVNRGIAQIVLDSGPPIVLDTYATAPGTVRSPVLPLTPGMHTVTVTVTGSKNSASSGTYIGIDAFVVSDWGILPNLPATLFGQELDGFSGQTVFIDDASGNPNLAIGSQWVPVAADSRFLNGTYHWTGGGGSCTLTFTGTWVALYGYLGPDQGYASMVLDGGAGVQVDMYRPTAQSKVITYSVSGLAYGTHTLTYQGTASGNPSSSGHTLILDAFMYGSNPLPTATGVLVNVMGINGSAVTPSSGAGTFYDIGVISGTALAVASTSGAVTAIGAISGMSNSGYAMNATGLASTAFGISGSASTVSVANGAVGRVALISGLSATGVNPTGSGVPVVLGTHNGPVTTAHACTVTASPAGAQIVVVTAFGQNGVVCTSLTDTVGNVYALIGNHAINGTTAYCQVWQAQNPVQPFVGGSVITAVPSSNAQCDMMALAIPGCMGFSLVDGEDGVGPATLVTSTGPLSGTFPQSVLAIQYNWSLLNNWNAPTNSLVGGSGTINGNSAGFMSAGWQSAPNASGVSVSSSFTGGAPAWTRMLFTAPVVVAAASGSVVLNAVTSGVSVTASSTSGSLTALGALTGSSVTVSGANGTVVRLGVLAGSSTAASGGSGSVTATGVLAGTSVSVSSTSGTLSNVPVLVGSSATVSTASGTVIRNSVLSGLSATSAGYALGTADIAGSPIIDVSGISSTLSASSGPALTTVMAVSGSSSGVSVATGTMGLEALIFGASSTASSGYGTVAYDYAIVGSSSSVSSGSGTLGTVSPVSGVSSAVVVSSGTVSLEILIEGSSATVSLGGGTLGYIYVINGSSVTVSDAVGVVALEEEISGASTTSSLTYGAIGLEILISGLSATGSAGSGSVVLDIAIDGSSVTVTDGDGSIVLVIEIDGLSATISSGAGSLVDFNAVDGMSSTVSYAHAYINPPFKPTDLPAYIQATIFVCTVPAGIYVEGVEATIYAEVIPALVDADVVDADIYAEVVPATLTTNMG